jgi:pilus assembly protein CpaB
MRRQGIELARLPSAGKSIAVVLAVVLAIAATFAIFTYVRGIEQRAFEDAELVEVFIAQELVPEGLAASEATETGLIARESAPRVTVPEGAISSLDQIEGLVTADRILAGEVVVRDRWVDPSQATVSFSIPDGFEALAIQVEVPPGVAGFVVPGDRVSLVATVAGPITTTTEDDGTVVEEQGEIRTQYLLQGIEVLSVGQRVITEEGEDGVRSSEEQVLLTVALEPLDVERAVFAIENAELYFTLLGEDAEPQETPGRTLADLFE